MRDRQFNCRARRTNERIPFGLILLVVGGALLARQFDVPLPDWVFTWEMLLITIGIMVGFANRFRDFGWLIIVAIGAFFLLDDVYPEIKQFVWPVVIILIGLAIIFRPSRQKKSMITDDSTAMDTPLIARTSGTTGKADVLEVVAVFGAIKKSMITKNFKGGEVVNVFGGSEINLTQADFQGTIKLEVVAIFGGAKIIVPANWQIRVDATAILGGVDDKREIVPMSQPEKLLILDGVAVCGGIEITSY